MKSLHLRKFRNVYNAEKMGMASEGQYRSRCRKRLRQLDNSPLSLKATQSLRAIYKNTLDSIAPRPGGRSHEQLIAAGIIDRHGRYIFSIG